MYSGKNGVSIQQASSPPPSAAMIRDIIWLPADCTRTHEPLVKHKSRKGEARPVQWLIGSSLDIGLPTKKNELWVVWLRTFWNLMSAQSWNEIGDSGLGLHNCPIRVHN